MALALIPLLKNPETVLESVAHAVLSKHNDKVEGKEHEALRKEVEQSLTHTAALLSGVDDAGVVTQNMVWDILNKTAGETTTHFPGAHSINGTPTDPATQLGHYVLDLIDTQINKIETTNGQLNQTELEALADGFKIGLHATGAAQKVKRSRIKEAVDRWQIFEHFDQDLTGKVLKRLAEFAKKYSNAVILGSDLEPMTADNMPQRKDPDIPIIYVGNHSGNSFPLDAIFMMATLYELVDGDFDKLPRPIVGQMLDTPIFDLFGVKNSWKLVGSLATPDFNKAMKHGASDILVMLEGVPGIMKGSESAYQMTPFAPSAIKTALEHGADVNPIYTVGAEFFNKNAVNKKWVNGLLRFVKWFFGLKRSIEIDQLPVSLLHLLPVIGGPQFTYFGLPYDVSHIMGELIDPYSLVEHISDESWEQMWTKVEKNMYSEKKGESSANKNDFFALKRAPNIDTFKTKKFAKYKTAWSQLITDVLHEQMQEKLTHYAQRHDPLTNQFHDEPREEIRVPEYKEAHWKRIGEFFSVVPAMHRLADEHHKPKWMHSWEARTPILGAVCVAIRATPYVAALTVKRLHFHAMKKIDAKFPQIKEKYIPRIKKRTAPWLEAVHKVIRPKNKDTPKQLE